MYVTFLQITIFISRHLIPKTLHTHTHTTLKLEFIIPKPLLKIKIIKKKVIVKIFRFRLNE